MITTVVFDLDNTLTHRNQSIHKFAQRLCELFTIPSGEAQAIGEIMIQEDEGGYGFKNSPFATNAMKIAHRLTQDHPKWFSCTPDQFNEIWEQEFFRMAEPMSGLQTLLDFLDEAEIPYGILSNGNDLRRKKTVAALNILDRTQWVLSSEAVGVKKPHADTFHAALKLAQCEPTQALMVGDHPVNDCAGAKAVGMQTCWLRGFLPWPEDQTPADFEIDHLLQLTDILSSR